VSIAATPQDATLDALTLEAWQRYAESLRAMTGRAYEDAEHDAWETLQAELADIAALSASDESF
jgi:hypothetical protein